VNTSASTSDSDPKLVAPDGSTLYYALLYLDDTLSTQVLETLHFIQTLSSTLNDVSEPQVAEKKIHWWHEELTRLSKQQARHPAAVCVQTYLNNHTSIKANLDILSAAANERYTPYATEQTLNDAITTDYGARLILLDQAMMPTPENKAQTNVNHNDRPIRFHAKPAQSANSSRVSRSQRIDAIALGLGQFDRLRSLTMRLRSGYSVFSDERYAQFGLSPDDLLNHSGQSKAQNTETQDKSQALIAAVVTQTRTSIEHAISCIAQHSATESTSLPVQIFCQVRYAQLKLWEKRRPNLLNESVTLTPLRKFFITFRCKRRFEHT